MTTWLSQREVDAYRSVKSAASILFLLGMIDTRHPGVPISSQDLAAIADEDERTVKIKLNSLCASGRVAKMGDGYILLEGGRALVLGMTPQIEALALSPTLSAQAQVTEVQAHSAPLSAITPTSPQPLQGASRMEDRHLGGVDAGTHNVCTLKGEGVSSSFSSKERKILTPPTQEDAQNVRTVHGITVLDILGATEILFGNGHPVFRKGLCLELLEKDVKSVLAIMAHCWQNRATQHNPRGLHSPANKAYTMLLNFLEDGEHPRREYQSDPWAHLPNEFKEVFGMACYECDVCHQTYAYKAEFEKHLAERDGHDEEVSCTEPDCEWTGRADFLNTHLKMHEEEKRVEALRADDVPFDEASEDSDAFRLWEKVKGQLQAEMPPASFDTWVRDAVAVRYDGHTLTVGARNAYARDWLDSRMQSTIARLAGIQVEFVA